MRTKEEISKLQTTIDTLTDKIEAMRGDSKRQTEYFEQLIDKAVKRIESLEAEMMAEKSIQKGYDDYHRRQDEDVAPEKS